MDGIAGMCTSGGFGDIISRNRNITRGIKVEMGGEEVSVDIYTIVEYGQPIQQVALEVQENVRKEAAADMFRYLPTEEKAESDSPEEE